MKRYAILSDVQAPYQNNRQVNSFAGFVKSVGFDRVLCVGDLFDLPMVSRWTRNRRGEFDSSIQTHIDTGRKILDKCQVTDLKVGNHDLRVERYVENYAPALSDLQGLRMENLFGLEELGVKLHRDLYEFAPGWVLAHGDEGPLSGEGGKTAMNLAQRIGKNVVCSHTHRQGIITKSTAMNGDIGGTLLGVEVGHMMDMHEAHYLKGGYGNWTPGFGVLYVSNSKVHAQVIQMSNTGSFIFEGRSFEDGRQRKGSSK